MVDQRIGSEYLTPIYSQADVAHIVSASPSTVQRWIAGYRQGKTDQPPIVDSVRPGRGDTVPFIGLAEVFVVNAFRKAGLPLQRIRPAVEVLKNNIGIDFALANDRLLTDGAEILWKSDDESDQRLVVLRNGNAVFNEVVTDYLRHIDFGPLGYAAALRLPQYTGLLVGVDPRLNGGRPTLSLRGIAVDDVLARIRAGEAPRDVADDYGLLSEDVLNLNRLAA
jgi:uncharacterized protein (DUF433 family)